ncbi:MAG: pantoate--beta-alanine ligase, partial [Thermodesulfobacteriota bacterium]
TIFVNPAQFLAGEDLESYPRDLKSDLEKARAAGLDVVFTPTAPAMYPSGFQTTVEVSGLQKNLCGESRPGHFTGVATVVLKLFNITMPHWAVFGEKDFQQLLVIKRMTQDLDLDVKIKGVPTVREADGLAMSSRNSYLSEIERRAAVCLPRSLNKAQEVYCEGMEAEAIIAAVKGVLKEEPLASVDYVKVVDAETLEDLPVVRGNGDRGCKTLVQAAVRIGRARLIDHILI